MKKKYRAFIKGTNCALAGLMAILGMSGCDDNMSGEMYGVPWKAYAIKGTVTDKETGNPIPGIEVSIEYPDSIKPYITGSWKEKTNEKGEFYFYDTPSGDVPIVSKDVDGELNGSYANDTTYVDYEKAEHLNGGKGWFEGELTATTEIKMEEKKDGDK